MGSRGLTALVALAAVAAACGSRGAAVPRGPDRVQVVVTRDFGARLLARGGAAPGQSALDALRRSAHVGTAYGGRFVQSVDGLEGDQSAGDAWLYYVNGIAPDVGAAEYRLHPGDREWWDYHHWTDLVQTPVVIGAWPEPFVHGDGDGRPAVSVGGLGCAAALRRALADAGAHVVEGASAFAVDVVPFEGAPHALSDWRRNGLTVALDGRRVEVYGRGGLRADARAQALIAAYRPAPGSAELVVAGATRAAACAAARTLAERPSAIAGTFAVALDGDGHVVAVGGRG